MGRSGVRDSSVGNPLLQNQKGFEQDIMLQAEEFWALCLRRSGTRRNQSRRESLRDKSDSEDNSS